MAFRPITSWKIEGEKVEVVTNFLFLGSKITGRGDCSHEIRRHLLLGRKAMTKLGSVLKSRDITLPRKVHMVKTMVFPVVTYGCESWTMKKAGRQRMNWLDGITNAMDTNLGKLWEMVRDRQSWCAVVHRVTKSQL